MSAIGGPAPGGGTPTVTAGRPPVLGWRVFPGEDRQLKALRGWLVTLLPDCPERHDLLTVATELASNAVKHTASGRGGTFSVALVGGARVMRVAVADGGAPAGPRMQEAAAGEHGRGLLIVRGLSACVGVCGDGHGRLVWAEIPWPVLSPLTPLPREREPARREPARREPAPREPAAYGPAPRDPAAGRQSVPV
jgi:anti-sigma regulatory factor (Ser/Thr protein kinase)